MEHIVSIEENREKVSQETETVTDRQKTFKLIFKALGANYTSKNRKIK